jgi:hypothetical protein
MSAAFPKRNTACPVLHRFGNKDKHILKQSIFTQPRPAVERFSQQRACPSGSLAGGYGIVPKSEQQSLFSLKPAFPQRENSGEGAFISGQVE